MVVNPTITNCWKELLLNVAEFLDPSLKTSPCRKTSLVLHKNQSFFLLLKLRRLLKVIVFFCYILQPDKVSLISFWDGCYLYLVFMDPVNSCSKTKLVKTVNLILKKVRFSYVCLFYLQWSIFSPPVDNQLKQLNPLC